MRGFLKDNDRLFLSGDCVGGHSVGDHQNRLDERNGRTSVDSRPSSTLKARGSRAENVIRMRVDRYEGRRVPSTSPHVHCRVSGNEQDRVSCLSEAWTLNHQGRISPVNFARNRLDEQTAPKYVVALSRTTPQHGAEFAERCKHKDHVFPDNSDVIQ